MPGHNLNVTPWVTYSGLSLSVLSEGDTTNPIKIFNRQLFSSVLIIVCVATLIR